MTDYDALLDDEIQAFVADTLKWYPADAYAQTIAQNRETYDAMCRAFFRGYPDGVTAKDTMVGSVPTRQYQCADAMPGPLVLYHHGGGFVLGGLDSHDDVCAEIAHKTGLPVWAVDYRLCPEHSRLDALEDAEQVFQAAVQAAPQGVILAGDSAGGWLAASLAHKHPNTPQLLGQVLIYPGLGGTMEKASMTRHAHAPLLSAEEVRSYGFGPEYDTHSPLSAQDFSGLPPTFVLAAECDPLADDGKIYASKVNAFGGNALSIEEPGLVHGHLRARAMSRRAARSFERVCQAMVQLAETGSLDENALRA